MPLNKNYLHFIDSKKIIYHRVGPLSSHRFVVMATMRPEVVMLDLNNDSSLRKWVKKVICLALVPVEKVEDVFEQLCIEKPDYYEKIDNFLDYVLLNYIKNDENDRYVYPLEVWNHYESEKRTNNNIEGYNSKLEKFLGTHPNIWLFINKIKAEESTATLYIYSKVYKTK